ncbi:MAG: sporulation initiation factor Spo0A C-terminal domain-containing protein [Eubacteriales bacterium]
MNLNHVYKQMAKEQGISVKKLKREMQASINDAFTNPNLDLWAKAEQDKVPRKGSIPTCDEFITYMSDKHKKI